MLDEIGIILNFDICLLHYFGGGPVGPVIFGGPVGPLKFKSDRGNCVFGANNIGANNKRIKTIAAIKINMISRRMAIFNQKSVYALTRNRTSISSSASSHSIR